MTIKIRAARSDRHHNRANVHVPEDTSIVHDFEIGSLVFGVIFAITFGLMFVHSAVML